MDTVVFNFCWNVLKLLLFRLFFVKNFRVLECLVRRVFIQREQE